MTSSTFRISIVLALCVWSCACSSAEAARNRKNNRQTEATVQADTLQMEPNVPTDGSSGDAVLYQDSLRDRQEELIPDEPFQPWAAIDTAGMSFDDKQFSESLIQVGLLVETNIDSLYFEWRLDALELGDSVRYTLPYDTIETPEEEYMRRMAEIPDIVQLRYNKVVRRFIDVYALDRRTQVSQMLTMSQYYFPIFEQELDKAGLPDELKYLPIIESALNPKATSRMGAAGLWQFMYSTGKMYGLQINSLTDERRDPVRSTEAAVKFLQSLYNTFGDWNLAIAAYNCGPGNVRKAINASGGKRDFWQIYYFLPRETRSYVPLFMAAQYVMTYHEEHRIYPAPAHFPMVCDTFHIHENMHFRQIADVCHIPIEEIRLVNPHFRNEIAHGTRSREGILYLPAQYTPRFVSLCDSIPNYRRAELLTNTVTEATRSGAREPGQGIVYRVRSGDNLYTIAKRYHVTVKQLRSWNNLRSDVLQIGQRLIIY